MSLFFECLGDVIQWIYAANVNRLIGKGAQPFRCPEPENLIGQRLAAPGEAYGRPRAEPLEISDFCNQRADNDCPVIFRGSDSLNLALWNRGQGEGRLRQGWAFSDCAVGCHVESWVGLSY